MRTLLGGELAQAQSWDSDYYIKLEVKNASGTWKDVGALLGAGWIVNATWGEGRDTAVESATLTLIRNVGAASLAPLMSASVLNVDDAAAYAPLLNIGRAMRFSTATMASGVALDPAKYRPALTGRIDDVIVTDGADGAPNLITLPCSDLGAWLMDLQIETDGVEYGDPVTPPTLESVLQAVIDDNIPAGEPAVTLVKQSASNFAVTDYRQGETKLLEGLITLVQDSVGEDLRYRFDASHVSQLMWFNPDRTRVTVDATFGPGQYIMRHLDISIKDIRNAGEMPYTEAGVSGVVTAEDPTSIGAPGNYRRRFFRLPFSRMLSTEAEAQKVIDTVVNDLSGPAAEAQADLPFCWFVQLFDRYTFQANAGQYDSDQTFAIGGYQHTIEHGRGSTVLTPLTARIVGAYAAWQRKLQPQTEVILPDFSEVATENSDGTVGTLTVTPRSNIQDRVSGCTFTVQSGRSAKVTLARQTVAPFVGTVAIDGSNKTPSLIEYVIDGIDASGAVAELRRGAVRFGVGSTPLDPDFKFSISAAGKPTVYLLGDSDTSYGKAYLALDGPPDFATIDTLGIQSSVGNRLGTMNDIGTVAPGRQYWIGVIAYNKDAVASAPVVKSGVWMGIGVTPAAIVTVNSITAQSGKIIFNLTLNDTAAELYIYVLETDTNPSGTPSVENRVATHFRDFSVGEPGISAGVPFNLSVPILRDNNYLLVTLVPYDYMGQRGTAVATKTAGVGGSPPAVPGAPTAAISSKTSTTVTNAVTLFGSGTVVAWIRPYVDGVAQADYDVSPDSASGTYNVISSGFAPSSTHTFRYAAVSAAGVESATTSATLTVTTDGGGGGGGTLPTPNFSDPPFYSIPDQATILDLVSDPGYPSGTVFHVEVAPTTGGPYVEDLPAQSTNLNLRSAITQTGASQHREYKVWATHAGWTDSARTASFGVTIPAL